MCVCVFMRACVPKRACVPICLLLPAATTRTLLLTRLTRPQANLVILLLVLACLARCAVKQRHCYRGLQAVAPRCVRPLERCGFGPSREEKEAWGDLTDDGGPAEELPAVTPAPPQPAAA